jgi:hypothetical protein
MLINRGEDPDKVSDEEMARIFGKHLVQVDEWLRAHPNVKRIDVNYNEILQNPLPEIERINHFLGGKLDTQSMGAVVDLNLYRQRVTQP